jgi:chemotaxis protein CheX
MEKFVQPFVKTCETVFRDFCQTDVKIGRVFFIAKDEYESNWDISGLIGLSGEVSGAVAISMKAATAFKITSILTSGATHAEFDADVTDAIGEIVNIISGNIKKDFEEELRIKISLPSIIIGKAHTIVWPSEKARIICIPFTVFSDQEFCLSVAVEMLK